MSFWVLSEANEMARMSAAQVTSRPVRASELTIAWRVSPVASYSSRRRESTNTS